jgi:hypothetical protein
MNFTNWRNTKTGFADDAPTAHPLDETVGRLQPVDLSQNFNTYAAASTLLADDFSPHARRLMKKG